MGLFGNDKEQDARIDALESHIRAISEAIQQNQLDVIKLRLALIKMESAVGAKVDAGEIDPAISALNDQLGDARDEYERMAAAAADSWATLHAGATDAVASLRSAVEEAAERVERELQQ